MLHLIVARGRSLVLFVMVETAVFRNENTFQFSQYTNL